MLILISIACNIILLAFTIRSFRNNRKQAVEKQIKENELLQKNLRTFILEVITAQTLNELFILHIQAWGHGIHHPDIGPDKYGIFRTEDILKMKPSEVYLGNVNGLFTKPLTYWETTSDIEAKKIVTEQYRHVLLSSLRSVRGWVENVALQLSSLRTE